VDDRRPGAGADRQSSRGVPPAATVAATASPCPSAPGSVCQLSADAAGQRVGANSRTAPPRPADTAFARPASGPGKPAGKLRMPASLPVKTDFMFGRMGR